MKPSKLLRTLFTMVLACFVAVLGAARPSEASGTFTVVIERAAPNGNWLPGQLVVNGNVLGPTLENESVKIPPGTYKGKLRTTSPKGFAQGPFGSIAKSGDFLLEVSDVANGQRKNILFHGGTKPEHSEGCILLGGIATDADGNRFVPDTTTLRKLRLAFYGTDTPTATPDLDITIIVKDVTRTTAACDWSEAVACADVAGRKGTRCGKPASYELDYTNRCPFPVKFVTCLQRGDGKWSCSPDGEFDTGVKPGGRPHNNYVCDGSGAHKVYAMPMDKFKSGRCVYPKS